MYSGIMITVKAGILFLCILFVHCGRLRKELEIKMFAMQKMAFQDIGMLKDSVDRNFEELQRLSMIINASLSQKSLLPTPVQTSAPESKEEESESKVAHLESQVRRLKRGFKDQKIFFHSWKENLSNEVRGFHKRIEKHSNEIADKVNETSNAVKTMMSFTKDTLEDVISVKEILHSWKENLGNEVKGLHKRIENIQMHSNEMADKLNETSNAVNAVMSFTKEDIGSKIKGIQDSLEFVMKFQDKLDSISQNVTTIKDNEVTNTLKLDTLSTVNRNFSEQFTSSLEVLRTEQKLSTSGVKHVLNTCSAAVQNSEQIINVLYTSVDINNIRLVGGSATSGRLEVFVKGTWGTVCDDDFYTNAAIVACKTLGLRGGKYRSDAYFGEGSGPILFDDVQCKGYERSLFHCKINYKHNCKHSEDIGVECYI